MPATVMDDVVQRVWCPAEMVSKEENLYIQFHVASSALRHIYGRH